MSNKKLVVLTGAGISVESGIKPFRGENGIWNENPTTMATYAKFVSDPGHFLSWYYERFVSCKDVLPNATHEILAKNNVRVITQNVDNLHKKANHPIESLIEIHGNINFKRKIKASSLRELVPANWLEVHKENQVADLFRIFNIGADGQIDLNASYRPHILLFDEFYTELYESEIALDWVNEADTVIFMGTSNSVGITSMTLEMARNKNKQVIVVDPNPAPSFNLYGVEIYKELSSDFCKRYFK